MVQRQPRADRRGCCATRSSGRPSCSASAASSPRRSPTWCSARPRSTPLTAAEMIDDLPTQRCSASSAARRRSTGTRSADCSSASGASSPSAPDVASVDVNPLIVDRRRAARRRRRPGRARRRGRRGRDRRGVRRRRPSSSAPCSSRAACSSPARRRHPGQVRVRVAAQPAGRRATPGQVFGTNLQGEEVLGVRTVADVAELPDGAADLVFVCTPAAANLDLLRACAAKGVRAAFLTSAGYGEAGEDGHAGRARAGRARRRARHPARRPERAGRREHAGVAVRADRRPVPAGGPHRRRQPERQLRVELPELRPGDRRRHQPGRVGRQRRRGHRGRLPRASTPTTRRRRSGWPTSRASPTAAACSNGSARRRGAQAARAREGRRDRRRRTGRGQPHRRAGRRRQGLRRRVPGRRDHAGGHGGGGVRGGGDVRHPARAGRAERRRAHDRRRLGRRHGRRDRPRPRPRAARPAAPTCEAAIDELLPPRWSRNNPVDCAGGETRDTIPAGAAS